MELLEAIKGRRSIRKFKNQPIPDETVTQLLEAATYAPSAGNIQPWQFIIAKNPEIKKKLSKAAYKQSQVEHAPVVIVVCVDEQQASSYGTRGTTLYCLQDTAAATQNFMLTAYSLGLGTCWIGAFKEDKVKEAVNAPEHMRPVAMIPIGFPDTTPKPRIRKPLSEIARNDSF
jgi:nitroreductase